MFLEHKTNLRLIQSKNPHRYNLFQSCDIVTQIDSHLFDTIPSKSFGKNSFIHKTLPCGKTGRGIERFNSLQIL